MHIWHLVSGWPSASIIIGPAPFSLPAGTRTLPKELRARGYAVGHWHWHRGRHADISLATHIFILSLSIFFFTCAINITAWCRLCAAFARADCFFLSQAHAVGKWHLGGNRFMNTPVGSTWGFETFTGLIQLRLAPAHQLTTLRKHWTHFSRIHRALILSHSHAMHSHLCLESNTLSGAGGHYSKTVSGPEGLAGAFYDYARAHENGTWAPFHDDRHSTVSLTEEAIAVMQRHADSSSSNNHNRNDHGNGQEAAYNAEGNDREAARKEGDNIHEEKNKQQDSKASPLFLYVAYTAGHTPLQADDAWLAQCAHLPHAYRRDYCGLLYGVDEVHTDPHQPLVA